MSDECRRHENPLWWQWDTDKLGRMQLVFHSDGAGGLRIEYDAGIRMDVMTKNGLRRRYLKMPYDEFSESVQ